MKVTLLVICVGIFSMGTAAFAGWNSGGGELFSDSGNPWFLENTEQVKYCIEIDSQHFGQTLATSRTKIQSALSYWRHEFQKVNPMQTSDGIDVSFATQKFIEVSCEVDYDIKFQLGTLDSEQVEYLKHPQKVIGVAVRTEYDPVSMRAKGFIYISPTSGPFELAGSGPIGRLVPDRWQYQEGKILESILIHELGHVFGAPHDDQTFMAEGSPSYMISWRV